MKRTISYKTQTGTTGEIYLDSDRYRDLVTEFEVTFGAEIIKGQIVDSKDHGGCLKVTPRKSFEVNGKKYSHIIIADPVATREFKEITSEMYEVYKWEKQHIVTDEDKEQLAKPTYFFYDGWEFKADMYEHQVDARIRKYFSTHETDRMVNWYDLHDAFLMDAELRKKAMQEGESMDNGYNKVKITDADVARIIEKYFADIDAAAAAEEQAEERAENRRKELIQKAKETGEPQRLYYRFVECNDPKEDCDLDVIAGYIDGEGNVEVTRQHLY